MQQLHAGLSVRLAALLSVALLVLPACVAGQTVGRQGEHPIPPIPPVPTTPASIKSILAARSFSLDTPFVYTWTKERIQVTTGLLVVLEVDPAYVVPRNALEPVLYAGDVPVQRLNHGHRSGRVLGIVPGNVDLATVPIWFGTPELPERITAAMVVFERRLAEKAGVRAFSAALIGGVQRPPVATADLASLLRTVGAELLYEFSPQEKELAESWRLPVASPPPAKNPN